MFGFPNPVNELAARTVAAGVLAMSVLTLLLSTTVGHGWLWILPVLVYGFLARVLTGPTLSPLGQLATRVIAPRLGPARLIAGPPKRFAQAIGAVITTAGLGFLAAGYDTVTQALLGVMIVASGLESIVGFCLGCSVFGGLMRLGLIPEATCEACADISLRAQPT